MTDAIDLTKDQLKQLTALLRRFLPGVAVWAYGSRVKWTARPNSDLDLVAFTTPAQRSQVPELKDALAESNVPFSVDLHVWEEVPERFREIIRKEYVVVQEAKEPQSGSGGLSMADETLPKGWTWTTLGTVADFVNGDRSENYPTQSDRVEAGVPFINTGHIDPNGRLTSVAMDYITRDSFERLRSGKVKAGDIVYCLRGSTIGKTARNHFTEGAIASSLVIVRAKANACQEFLYFYLTSPLGQQLVKQHDNGSAQPNLSVRSLCNYPLPLPPLPEQRTIAHILGTLDDKIELNRRMNETLEAMARALFKSWFVDFDPVRAKAEGRDTGLPKHIADLFPDSFEDSELGEIPRGWVLGEIQDCCTQIQNGGTPRRNEPRFWDGGNIPWLASGEVRQAIVTATEGFITEAGLNESSAKWVPAYSTVIALYGATAGQVSLVSSPLTTNQAVCALVPKKDFAFFNYLSMRDATSDLESKAVGSAQQNISKGIVQETQVILPPNTVIERFAISVGPMFDRWIANLYQSRTLVSLRDTLLPKLISGELRVKDAERFVERAL